MVAVNTTAPMSQEATAASVPRVTSWTRTDTAAQVKGRLIKVAMSKHDFFLCSFKKKESSLTFYKIGFLILAVG